MDTVQTLTVLIASARETQLGVFRLLLKAGREGLPAGEVAAHATTRLMK